MWHHPRPSTWQRVQHMAREANYPPQNEQRVVRDVSDAHQRWPSLTPRLELYTSDTGHQSTLVMLKGTVPVTYRGSTYNIPVQVVVMSYHPSGPPVMHVKPTANMDLKERHDHVDRNGQVYLPYLNNWDATRSTLVGAITAMAEVFARVPPVYATAYDERARLRAALTARVRARLTEVSEEAATDAAALLARRDGAAEKVDALKREHSALTTYINNNNVRAGDIDVDSMIHPRDIHSEQIMQCLAKDSALGDALAQIEDAVGAGTMELDVFLRETSRLAREQFYARALLRKVKMAQAQSRRSARAAS